MNRTKIFSSFAKRLLTAFIVLVLAVGLVPVTAYVENEVQGEANLAYAESYNVYYGYGSTKPSGHDIYDRLDAVINPWMAEVTSYQIYDEAGNHTELSWKWDKSTPFNVYHFGHGQSEYSVSWSGSSNSATLYLQEKVTTNAPENATYDGQEHKWVPEVRAAVGNRLLSENNNYTVKYFRDNVETNDFTSAGTISVKIQGLKSQGEDDYSYYSYEGSYTIAPASITVDVAGKSDTVTYNGKEQSVSGFEVTNTGSSLYTADKVALKDGVTVEAKGTDAGTYETALSADDLVNTDSNFNVTFNVTNGILTIEQCAIEVKDSSSVVYNGKEQVLNIEASKATGLVKGHELTLENAQIKGTEVGSYDKVSEYTWKVMDGDIDVSKNYTINVSGKLTITKETPVTPQTGDSTMLYVGVALGVAAIAAALVAFLATRKLRGSAKR
jgi:hypothetical protein